MLYTLADTHLSFSVEKPMDIFGDRWENHAARLEENWRSVIEEDDTVVIPGDISWGIDLAEARADFLFLESLPGKKLIGKGNHDYWWTSVKKMTAFLQENAVRTISFLYNNAYEADEAIVCGTRGWMSEFGIKAEDERIIEREAIRLKLSLDEGERLREHCPEKPIRVFLHYPVVYGSFINDTFLDILYRYGIEDVYYGHLHGVRESQLDKEYLGIRFHLVAGDYLGFMPLKIT